MHSHCRSSVLSETADAFVKEAYDLGWVEGDFDWGTWMGTPEALSLRDSPASLAKLPPLNLHISSRY